LILFNIIDPKRITLAIGIQIDTADNPYKTVSRLFRIKRKQQMPQWPAFYYTVYNWYAGTPFCWQYLCNNLQLIKTMSVKVSLEVWPMAQFLFKSYNICLSQPRRSRFPFRVTTVVWLKKWSNRIGLFSLKNNLNIFIYRYLKTKTNPISVRFPYQNLVLIDEFKGETQSI